VVILSTIERLTSGVRCVVGHKEQSIRGASFSSVVKAQTVMEAVGSKLSS
jgi:hypothetical protein